ncbi:hypothetical protein CsatA_003493 [Cannabis sativa]
MAPKYSYSILFILLLLQISQSFSNESLCNYYEYRHSNNLCRSCYLDWYKTTKNTNIVIVEVANIVKALENTGYQIMSTILDKNLNPDIINPYCHDDFMFFMDGENRFIIYGENNTITLFVPPNKAVRFEKWIDLKYQIVMGKFDKEAFESGSLSKGSTLESSTRSKEKLLVTQVFDNGTVSINNVKITKWNIYNDGHVIVHGTEDFFNHFQGEKQYRENFWEKLKTLFNPISLLSSIELFLLS